METTVAGTSGQVTIGGDRPTVLIGERINPSGRRKLADSLEAGDMSIVRREAIAQVEAGADILDVNVGSTGADKSALLARAVEAVSEVVGVPLSLDSDDSSALEAALKICRGKPIVNSVTGQAASLEAVLPLVKEYGAAVIALTMDDEGIPADSDRRLAIAHRIVERAAAIGIRVEDVIVDCLTMTVATDPTAALVTLESVRRVKAELGVNQTLGASNVSFGLPDRDILNGAFLTMAIEAGVTCPTVHVARVRPTVLAADLFLGRDGYARRFIKDYRRRQQ
jgi:5-methyltetrahydrofolate--homocysteine methyltransferase